MPEGLGRRVPQNWDHVVKYPLLRKLVKTTVEKTLILPQWYPKHNQGQQGACVGHGVSLMLAMLNEHQCRQQGELTPYIRYNPWWLWDKAKEVDGFEDTNPGDDNGTTVNAAVDVLIKQGHVTWPEEDDPKSTSAVHPEYGVNTVRWATTVDEMRTAINADRSCSIGVNWYSGFDNPRYVKAEYWIGKGVFGSVEGGHCVCIYGASDERQAFRLANSWGPEYPIVWLPYKAMARLLKEDGESALVTDR